jgi:hypothetical protein
MSVKRKEHSAEFKAKVALEALRGRKPRIEAETIVLLKQMASENPL